MRITLAKERQRRKKLEWLDNEWIGMTAAKLNHIKAFNSSSSSGWILKRPNFKPKFPVSRFPTYFRSPISLQLLFPNTLSYLWWFPNNLDQIWGFPSPADNSIPGAPGRGSEHHNHPLMDGKELRMRGGRGEELLMQGEACAYGTGGDGMVEVS